MFGARVEDFDEPSPMVAQESARFSRLLPDLNLPVLPSCCLEHLNTNVYVTTQNGMATGVVSPAQTASCLMLQCYKSIMRICAILGDCHSKWSPSTTGDLKTAHPDASETQATAGSGELRHRQVQQAVGQGDNSGRAMQDARVPLSAVSRIGGPWTSKQLLPADMSHIVDTEGSLAHKEITQARRAARLGLVAQQIGVLCAEAALALTIATDAKAWLPTYDTSKPSSLTYKTEPIIRRADKMYRESPIFTHICEAISAALLAVGMRLYSRDMTDKMLLSSLTMTTSGVLLWMKQGSR